MSIRDLEEYISRLGPIHKVSTEELEKSLSNIFLAEELGKREKINGELEEALGLMERLCVKLSTIFDDPSYVSVFQTAFFHGNKYTGPNCSAEKEAMEEFLRGHGKLEGKDAK